MTTLDKVAALKCTLNSRTNHYSTSTVDEAQSHCWLLGVSVILHQCQH